MLAVLVLGALSLSALAFASVGDFKMAVVMGVLDVASAAAIVYQSVCLGRTIYHALEILTKKLDLLSVKATDTQLITATSASGEA
ncbi:MAG TPA: hypothetical protein DCE56_00770 [Cyanobacteria bacterium UBA8553]|nr:hypothetical protein [Cyanobacteria bacterium UBA8553]